MGAYPVTLQRVVVTTPCDATSRHLVGKALLLLLQLREPLREPVGDELLFLLCPLLLWKDGETHVNEICTSHSAAALAHAETMQVCTPDTGKHARPGTHV